MGMVVESTAKRELAAAKMLAICHSRRTAEPRLSDPYGVNTTLIIPSSFFWKVL
jgi:hypothetical protein